MNPGSAPTTINGGYLVDENLLHVDRLQVPLVERLLEETAIQGLVFLFWHRFFPFLVLSLGDLTARAYPYNKHQKLT